MLKVNLQNIIYPKEELLALKSQGEKAKETLVKRTGAGSEYLGWLDWPVQFDRVEFQKIIDSAKQIRSNSNVLVVIGIGGSYLGAKAVYEALSPYFKSKDDFEIVFAGHTLSAPYLVELLDYLKDKEFSVNVISKSGTTTEPAIAFRAIKALLEEKYGSEASKRIYATTDMIKGALRKEANELGYVTFNVPDNIGGRYSVFTAVGLLPLACAGINIQAFLQGAALARQNFIEQPFESNDALLYASARYLMSQKGKTTEILVAYEPKLSYINEWWKQLFGESEGKDGKGIFPASLIFSTDLHSLGQYVQDGQRIMFETVLNIKQPNKNFTLIKETNDLDQLNYLAGKTLDDVNKKAMEGTLFAHVDGNVPNIIVEIDKLDEVHLGYLLYFFMVSCGISCYLTEVNPFNQPGVESYKKNMFALLGKPGFETLRESLTKRLK